ncbi:MAG: acyl carrier protein [Firmicutes bacterium]|nr:acyl carrier protein [Bacillota bacterium]
MVFDKIADIIAEKLEIDKADITPESSFNDMQVDSLYMVEIMLSIEEEFDLVIDDASTLETVADLVAYVEERI